MKGLSATNFNHTSFVLHFVPEEDPVNVPGIFSLTQDSKVPFFP
jgi:hypothetical protein